MKIVYRLDCLAVTKSDVDGTYMVHINRVPVLTGSAEAMLDLARAIIEIEESEK